MTYCKKPGCKLFPWRKRLCYRHWKLTHGCVFDAQQKRYVKSA